jgi:hypothetical protein
MEPVHHCAADFEGMNGDKEEHSHADLDAALDGGPEQVEGEYGVGYNREQGESVVQFNDDGVQEGAQALAAVEHEREDDLYDPRPRDDHAPHADEQLGPGDEWVAACLFVADLQAFVLHLELVPGGR